MIAKRIRRGKASSDFARLGRYILGAPTAEAEVLWTRTAAYILDTASQGAKVGWSRITNCRSGEPGWAIAEILATQRANTRLRSDPTYHLVVSFPAGERPTRAQLEDIEDTLCEGLGFAGHQRLSAVHTDTDHLHVHIAINRVHPVTLRAVEPYYDHPKLAELCGVLEARHGLTSDNHMETGRAAGPRTPDGAAALEAHRGERSLQGWIRETAGAALTACREQGRGWADLHRALARYGLEIRSRGAGLAIVDTGSGLAVRASAVDRGLSMAALSGRWGAYAPPTGVRPEPEWRYRPQPLHAHPAADDLHARYRRERDQALAARRSALADLRARHAAYRRDLAGWYRDRHQELRRDRRLTLRDRRRARLELEHRRRDDLVRQRRLEARQRRDVGDGNRLASWSGFLRARAEAGDTTALAVLRSREARRARLAGDLLRAADPAAARAVVFDRQRPRARHDGTLVYRTRDGGVVCDEAACVRVEEVTPGAAFAALALARERFGDRPLVVEGSAAFRDRVARAAALPTLDVRLADPALEAERRRAAGRRGGPVRPPGDADGRDGAAVRPSGVRR